MKKFCLYTLWYFMTTILAVGIHQIGMETNSHAARCDTYAWQTGNLYQWVTDAPCMYTAEFLLGYYFYFILYLIFDYGRRRIVGKPVSIRHRLMEICVWFLFYWGNLLWLTAKYTILNHTLIRTSFFGAFLFFLPIFGLSLLAKKIPEKKLLIVIGIMITVYLATLPLTS